MTQQQGQQQQKKKPQQKRKRERYILTQVLMLLIVVMTVWVGIQLFHSLVFEYSCKSNGAVYTITHNESYGIEQHCE